MSSLKTYKNQEMVLEDFRLLCPLVIKNALLSFSNTQEAL